MSFLKLHNSSFLFYFHIKHNTIGILNLTDTLHINGCNSINNDATELCHIPQDSQYHRPTFGMSYITVTLFLQELQIFPRRVIF